MKTAERIMAIQNLGFIVTIHENPGGRWGATLAWNSAVHGAQTGKDVDLWAESRDLVVLVAQGAAQFLWDEDVATQAPNPAGE